MPTHIAFSDDSTHQDGRYNSLSIVSIPVAQLGFLVSEVKKILSESDITSEFKWNRVASAKYYFAAEKLIDLVFKNREILLIDTVTWNLDDGRHSSLVGRDDSENLVRMYYHLVSHTLSRRWPIKTSSWTWRPDHQSSVDWGTLQDCIKNKKHRLVRDIFGSNPDFEQVNLLAIEPSESTKNIPIQIADLFAGVTAFSHGHNKKYFEWERVNSNQLSLLPNTLSDKPSNSESYKYKAVKKLDSLCKANSLQVSLRSSKGFNSNNQKSFLNFWLYERQNVFDRAPVRRTQA